MKALLSFIAGLIIGAFLLYGFLWYQVFGKLIDTWCQIYTGPPTVEMYKECKDR